MNRLAILFSAVTLSWTFCLIAQTDKADLKQKFVQARDQNTAATQRYTWKCRTELKVKNESKKVKVEQVRFGSDGKEQKITLEESSPQPEQQQQGGSRRGGRLKNKIIENKKEEFGELMQNLAVLGQAYAHIPADQMQSFMKNAQFSPGKAPVEGTVLISGKGVLQPEDSMSIWIDQHTLLIRQIEINTSLDKKPVAITVEYIQLTNGPAVQSRTTLQYPQKQILVAIENYDHQQL